MTAISSRDIAATQAESPKPHLDHPMGVRTLLIFLAVMALGLFFAAYNIYRDISAAGATVTSILPFLLLGVALLIALGFEFVNGFHDTANAVATVIYTHSLAPPVAVVWSGFFNFLGVLLSTGAVAFGIVSLLPVELILQVGSEAGFAMVFAMRRDHLESRYVVARLAGLQLAYFDWLDHWGRYRQRADARTRRNVRS